MSYAPCKECVNRKVGCHSTCEDYAEYLQDFKAKKKYVSAREGDIYTAEYIRNRKQRKKH